MHEADMLKTLPQLDSNVQPTPRFASDVEIEFATQLRHQLEERYLEPPSASSSVESGSPPESGGPAPGRA